MSESTEIVPVETSTVAVRTFSLDEALTGAWERTWKNIWPMTGICTATFLYSMLPQVTTTVITWVGTSPALLSLGLLLGILGLVMSFTINLGYINLWLRMLDGKPVVTRDVFTTFDRIGPYTGSSLLYHMIVPLGYLCFIFPGIFLQLALQFNAYFIVEYKLGPVAALKASYELTKGIKIDLFLLGVVQGFIGFAGGLCLLVGGFPAWIMNSLTTADVFRQLMRNIPEERMIRFIPNLAELRQLQELEAKALIEMKTDDAKLLEINNGSPPETAEQPPTVAPTETPPNPTDDSNPGSPVTPPYAL